MTIPPMPSMSPRQDEAWDTVRRVNQAWVRNRTEELEALLQKEGIAALDPTHHAEPEPRR